jgi:DNA-binding CsgD family transcriptional regulator
MTVPETLLGRSAECAAIDQLLRTVRVGASGSLLVCGEPGVGKSAILDYAAEAADGFTLIRVTGIESEMEFAFAALHLACAQLVKHLGEIPGPQAEALRVAFGLSHGDPPDRFLVGLGVLSLAAEEAAAQPVLCVIDDAQWIDQTSLQALALTARRLRREAVAMVFAARSSAVPGDLAGIPELQVGGLPEADARTLLASVVPGRLDERVRDRVVAEAAGNPLALLEFSREITEAGDLAGGFGVSPWVPRPLADRIAERYLARATALPLATRRVLLIAAAEPLGDPALLHRAGATLGLSTGDLGPAEADGLVRLGAQVTFRHPLVRSAIYRSAPAADRQAAHAALAEATDSEHDLDRRAWHQAHATFGPDEKAATDLEQSANRALGRGGPAAAAAFLERAAALSPEPAERARRNLAAAQPRYDAGAPREAARLLAAAAAGPLGELQRARADQLAARIASVLGSAGDAPKLLLTAAARFGPRDAGLARRAYLDALMSAMTTGGAAGTGWREVGLAARDAPPPPGPRRPEDLFLDGLVAWAADGYQAGLPALRSALLALTEDHARVPAVTAVSILWLGCRTAMNLWDDESFILIAARLVSAARGTGAVMDLPGALGMATTAALLTGDFGAAASFVEQTDAMLSVTGSIPAPHGRLALAAWQGRTGLETGQANERAASLGIPAYTTALLFNGLGRYEEALIAARLSGAHAVQLGYSLWALPEQAEAAARCGRLDLAKQAVTQLADTAAVAGTDWGLGIQARSRALTCEGPEAEDCYQEAIARLARTRTAPHLARAHLLYGEWLRREKRRSDARRHLRTASEMLAGMGARGFAERAERELAATGERIRKRDLGQVAELTPQEAQIARLASEGQSNPEIAEQLFISPRTVEYHLHKTFAKLGITSRGQLTRALAAQ